MKDLLELSPWVLLVLGVLLLIAIRLETGIPVLGKVDWTKSNRKRDVAALAAVAIGASFVWFIVSATTGSDEVADESAEPTTRSVETAQTTQTPAPNQITEASSTASELADDQADAAVPDQAAATADPVLLPTSTTVPSTAENPVPCDVTAVRDSRVCAVSLSSRNAFAVLRDGALRFALRDVSISQEVTLSVAEGVGGRSHEFENLALGSRVVVGQHCEFVVTVTAARYAQAEVELLVEPISESPLGCGPGLATTDAQSSPGGMSPTPTPGPTPTPPPPPLPVPDPDQAIPLPGSVPSAGYQGAPAFNVYGADVASYGDESDFLTVAFSGSNDFSNRAEICDGDYATLRIYIHNGQASQLNTDQEGQRGIARGTTLKIEDDSAGLASSTRTFTAKIAAENGGPREVADRAEIYCSEGPVLMSVIAAKMYIPDSNSFVDYDAWAFGRDQLVAPDGSESGIWPGCWEHLRWMFIQVQAIDL